ncbi:hypothetical protein QUF88_06535 [Bacillus sp. DX1.1]|uniref:hypothetical protein n=1 Tax=unclassified Bacillus (in: firmicutes) TaxID=185979 RepID=UPI00256FBDC9|nr:MULTISPECIES: hypothetical protein [unclassified Bacillus (in: firmicutes)]MDM5153503.1 hypothetical protein [Bacillus sp. DX1.1]WJE82456.1 hypothetical protein QRE67_04055 [Bacillus sp. DX3.1]
MSSLQSFMPHIDESTRHLGNMIFIGFGGVCILIGLFVMLINRRNSTKIRRNIGLGLLIVGVLSLLNNLMQLLY